MASSISCVRTWLYASFSKFLMCSGTLSFWSTFFEWSPDDLCVPSLEQKSQWPKAWKLPHTISVALLRSGALRLAPTSRIIDWPSQSLAITVVFIFAARILSTKGSESRLRVDISSANIWARALCSLQCSSKCALILMMSALLFVSVSSSTGSNDTYDGPPGSTLGRPHMARAIMPSVSSSTETLERLITCLMRPNASSIMRTSERRTASGSSTGSTLAKSSVYGPVCDARDMWAREGRG